jgi:hypothetical protein
MVKQDGGVDLVDLGTYTHAVQHDFPVTGGKMTSCQIFVSGDSYRGNMHQDPCPLCFPNVVSPP